MRMYPKHDLYKLYKERLKTHLFSAYLPDVTKRNTLANINFAINVTDNWDVCMDIGGGSGHYLAPLAGKFKKAILVEVEKMPEQELYEKEFQNFKVINSYIEEYKNTEKVNFILMADLYEHIPKINEFIEKISTLQGPGDVVYIMTPNPVYCGPAPESGIFYTRHPNGHIKQYTTLEITRLMNKHGYELILKMYEEAPFRQLAKRFIFALSRRDKNWRNNILYWFIRPLYLLISIVISKLLEVLTYYSEIKNRNNEFKTMTQDLVFKKINVD